MTYCPASSNYTLLWKKKTLKQIDLGKSRVSESWSLALTSYRVFKKFLHFPMFQFFPMQIWKMTFLIKMFHNSQHHKWDYFTNSLIIRRKITLSKEGHLTSWVSWFCLLISNGIMNQLFSIMGAGTGGPQ